MAGQARRPIPHRRALQPPGPDVRLGCSLAGNSEWHVGSPRPWSLDSVAVTRLAGLLDKWRADLAAWAIPETITAGIADSPWVLPRQVFARRADRLTREPGGASYEREREALAAAGTVLDIGSGAGAACLPLAPLATTVTAVDTDRDMLTLLGERAAKAGLDLRTTRGAWPDVAQQVAPA